MTGKSGRVKTVIVKEITVKRRRQVGAGGREREGGRGGVGWGWW